MAKTAKILACVLLVIVAVCASALTFLPTFGGSAIGERLASSTSSPQFKHGKFENEVPQTPRSAALIWDYAKRQFGPEIRHPPKTIPVINIDPRSMASEPAPGLQAIWFGHATVYLELDQVRIMLDPVLSDYASPIAGIGPRRFHPPPIPLDALPHIDAVLISHDHYDHLDMRTVKALAAGGTQFFVPLGIGAHLARWGINASQISELDWWQTATLRGVTFTSTPARHYSGRGLRDGNATLWTSWAIAGSHKVYFSGDTGFSQHFEEIGRRLGPFDLSLIKIGAYGPGQTWIDIHMDPELAVLAHVAVRAKRFLPIHWGTYNLAFHVWDEPIKRAVTAARASSVDIVTPRVGELVPGEGPFTSISWWE